MHENWEINGPWVKDSDQILRRCHYGYIVKMYLTDKSSSQLPNMFEKN